MLQHKAQLNMAISQALIEEKIAPQKKFSFYFVSGNYQEAGESKRCMTEKFIGRRRMWNEESH